MTSELIDKIYSDDYADFIIAYNGDRSILDVYPPNSVQIVNFFLAIVHLPVAVMTEDVISRMGYGVLPSFFGLVSEAGLEASGILRLRNVPNFDLRGKGVLMGFVDTGIDYTNSVFQYEDQTTRIVSIWDQTIRNPEVQEGLDYGTEYTKEQIDAALKSEDPFSIVPSKDEIGHGTMIAGIAAGRAVPEKGFYGVAPDTELVIVKLKPAKPYIKRFFRVPEDAIGYQENDIITGIQYLLNYAVRVHKPIVICICTDTSQYAHDGRGTTSNWLSLMANLTGVAIVLPVGNEGNNKRHYAGVIKQSNELDTVELIVGPADKAFSMELWGSMPNKYWIDITTPSGEYIPRIDVKLNETREISFIFEPTIIYVDYEMIESQSGDQLILLRFSNTAQGIWKFRVYSRGVFPNTFHLWLPMNNYISLETYFIRSDPNITLLSLSCSDIPITVTAYNTDDDSLFWDAGRGYTRIGIVKPELAAPGVRIVSPSLNQEFVEVTGTSAAAAHTAGVAAMLLEWGIVRGVYPKMSTTDMKIFMLRGARRNVDREYPNPDWGYGILDVYNIFDIIR